MEAKKVFPVISNIEIPNIAVTSFCLFLCQACFCVSILLLDILKVFSQLCRNSDYFSRTQGSRNMVLWDCSRYFSLSSASALTLWFVVFKDFQLSPHQFNPGYCQFQKIFSCPRSKFAHVIVSFSCFQLFPHTSYSYDFLFQKISIGPASFIAIWLIQTIFNCCHTRCHCCTQYQSVINLALVRNLSITKTSLKKCC